tara:strand:+ start:1709 stop:2170 length:462 start_codon:yes stop_codon:yes gene_type:complete
MITGETEQILDRHLQDEYDDFFGNKKKRRARRAKRLAKRTIRRSEPKRIERKQKQQRFLKDVGQVYRDIGGATAIGAAIDSITKPNLPTDYGTSSLPEQSDFSIDIGAPKELEEEKKGIPTVVFILGGVVVVGVIGLALMSSNKNKQYQHYPK